MSVNRVFSAIQPTGHLHLGNYIGALKNWVKMQQSDSQLIYSIADLHALTIPQDPHELRNSIRHLTAAVLACGVSPDRAIVFQQSSVPEHTELSWIFSCFAPFHRLNAMSTFKVWMSVI